MIPEISSLTKLILFADEPPETDTIIVNFTKIYSLEMWTETDALLSIAETKADQAAHKTVDTTHFRRRLAQFQIRGRIFVHGCPRIQLRQRPLAA